MTTTVYKTIQPPFTLKFWEMSKKELREYFRWFQEVIPERIAELASAVKSSPGFEDWKSDYTPASLNALGDWFATKVQTRLRTKDEVEEIAAESSLPRSARELTDDTISMAMDIAMYLSQVLLQNHPALKWDQAFGGKKYIDYGQPVLVGFSDGIPMNPVRVITTVAYGLVRGSYTGKTLREMYDKLQKQLSKAEPLRV
jgi:hypothetical protein